MGPFETGRLMLRRFEETDFESIYRLIYVDKEVYGMYSSIGGDYEAARERFMHAVFQPPNSEFGRLAVAIKSSGQVIGQIHLDPHVWTESFLTTSDNVTAGQNGNGTIEVELAFAFGMRYWGNGYAFEACKRMIDYAFEELHLRRLVGGAMLENERSINLHRRLGYRLVRNSNPDDPVGWITILDNESGAAG